MFCSSYQPTCLPSSQDLTVCNICPFWLSDITSGVWRTDVTYHHRRAAAVGSKMRSAFRGLLIIYSSHQFLVSVSLIRGASVSRSHSESHLQAECKLMQSIVVGSICRCRETNVRVSNDYPVHMSLA